MDASASFPRVMVVTSNRPLCPCATKESKIGWYFSPLITTATTTITITNNITRTETPWITNNNNNNKQILKNGVWEREREKIKKYNRFCYCCCLGVWRRRWWIWRWRRWWRSSWEDLMKGRATIEQKRIIITDNTNKYNRNNKKTSTINRKLISV